METKTRTASGGVGLLGLLALLFIGLKLGGVIDWSWWLITAPLWLPTAVLLSIVLCAFTVAGVCWLLLKILDRVEASK